MKFNGVTEYLFRWCADQREHYRLRNQQERANTGRSLLFVKRFFFDEMSYKLLYLVDGEFADFAAYLERVRELIPLRKSYILRNLSDPEALELLEEAEKECLKLANRITELDAMEPGCYCRALFGEERERLEYEIREKWGYCAEYWYPQEGGFDESRLFLNVQYLEPYWNQLQEMLSLPGQRLYEYGESLYEDGKLLEVDRMEDYCGCECAYLPRNLRWIIYFSHEETVTFAGDILQKVKELLESERIHWNQWD